MIENELLAKIQYPIEGITIVSLRSSARSANFIYLIDVPTMPYTSAVAIKRHAYRLPLTVKLTDNITWREVEINFCDKAR